MILTLEVIGEQADDLGAASRKVFNAIGGTIGRLPDNDWVFPDPYVSGRHALIRYLNGKFFIEDTSTNGVFINSPDNRLPRTQPHQLRNGDLLFIDAYEIRVSIENDPAAASRNDPFAKLKAAKPAPQRTVAVPAASEEDRTESMALRGRKEADDEDFGDTGEHGTQWFGMSEMPEAKPAVAPARGRARSESFACRSVRQGARAQESIRLNAVERRCEPRTGCRGRAICGRCCRLPASKDSMRRTRQLRYSAKCCASPSEASWKCCAHASA